MSSQVSSDDELPANLAAAINALAKSLSTLKKSCMQTKVCELDVFDRYDTCKIQPFLVQYTLNFRNCPDAFSSNSAKVTFTLSYLKGTMLDWFELSLTSSKSLPWLDDYPNSVMELKNNFRLHDPKGKAEADLENLHMSDNQCIVKYLIDFNHLTAHI